MSDNSLCDLCRNYPSSGSKGDIKYCTKCEERHHRLISGFKAQSDQSVRLSKSKMETITGLSPEGDRFLIPLDWYNIVGLHDTYELTLTTPDQPVDELIAELSDSVNRLGVKRALTYIAATRLLSKLEYSTSASDIGIPPRMVEFSVALIGSFSSPHSNKENIVSFQQRLQRLQSLTDQELAGGYRSLQHRSYGPELFRMYSLLEQLYAKFSSKYDEFGEQPFDDDVSMAAAAQNSELVYGHNAYPEQYLETMERIYAPYQIDFLNNLNIDMIKARQWASQLLEESYRRIGELFQTARFYQADCLRLLGGIQEATQEGARLIDYLESPLHASLQRGELESWAHFISKMEQKIWFSKDELIQFLDIFNEERVKTFLERISISVGEYEATTPFGFNQLESTPLLEVDNEYLLFYPQMFTRALSKTFFYDLKDMNDEGDLTINFNVRGEFLEHWAYDLAMQLFIDKGEVHRNVEWEGENEEIDVVGKWGSVAIIMEVKSKFLTDRARKGGIYKIKDDLEKGILGAVDQLDRKIESLKKDVWSFSDANNPINFDNEDIDEYIPIVVMGGEYDRIATMDYVSMIDDDTLVPYVISIYDLDVLSRILNTEHFVKYARERNKIAADRQLHSMDEIDFLGLYSKTGPDLYESVPTGNVLEESADDPRFHFIGGIEGAGDRIRPLLTEYGSHYSARWLAESEMP